MLVLVLVGDGLLSNIITVIFITIMSICEVV